MALYKSDYYLLLYVAAVIRIFGGFVNDIKNRYPYYLSDITDALTMQCVASVFFIFFAVISPVVTFGGVMGQKTEDHLVSALCYHQLHHATSLKQEQQRVALGPGKRAIRFCSPGVVRRTAVRHVRALLHGPPLPPPLVLVVLCIGNLMMIKITIIN